MELVGDVGGVADGDELLVVDQAETGAVEMISQFFECGQLICFERVDKYSSVLAVVVKPDHVLIITGYLPGVLSEPINITVILILLHSPESDSIELIELQVLQSRQHKPLLAAIDSDRNLLFKKLTGIGGL